MVVVVDIRNETVAPFERSDGVSNSDPSRQLIRHDGNDRAGNHLSQKFCNITKVGEEDLTSSYGPFGSLDHEPLWQYFRTPNRTR